ncbi:MAG: porin [Candidatus Marinimicrobia bacterium]|nr:porin [Candidatus Neomarinimicrobiota bacterium]
MKKFKLIIIMLLSLVFVALAFGEKSEGSTEWDDGTIKWKSNDGNFQTFFDVRMYINAGYFFEGENELSNGTHLRKARFAVKTKLWKVWKAEWDMDIAEGVVEVKDMYFSYVGFNNTHLKFGHFKQALGLNELMSSRYQTFIERSYPMLAFETDRKTAIEYSRWGKRWNIRSSVFGQEMDINKNKTKDETGGGYAVRLVYAPQITDNLMVHLGGAYVMEKPSDESNAVEFKSEPETKLGDVEILDTGTIRDVDNTVKLGLEGVLKYKGISIQSEFVSTKVARLDSLSDVNLDGTYTFLSWILTGEERPWDNTQGEFGQIMPENKYGAWELVARFSHLNLSDLDAGVTGGKANNYTFGLNWYPNPNMKMQFNYTMVKNSVNATGDGFIGGDEFSVAHFMAVIFF